MNAVGARDETIAPIAFYAISSSSVRTVSAGVLGDGECIAPVDTSAAAVVRAYIDAYNAHDVEKILSFLATDFVWLSIAGDSVTVEARGSNAIRAQLLEYFRSIPTARSEFSVWYYPVVRESAPREIRERR